MEIDHIGYAVKEISRSINEFSKLGYEFEDIIIDEKRNISICFGHLGNWYIELIAPIKNGKPTPVDSYINRYGNIPYHICYCSDCFEEDIANLNKQGFRTIMEPDNASAFDNRRVAFLMNLGVGILEIVERKD